MNDGPDPATAARSKRRRRRRRRVMWLMVAFASVVGIAVAGAIAYPTAAAATCPRCYGLVGLRENLYAERGGSRQQQAELIAAVTDATRQVGDFYGGRISSPDILACFSTGCYRRIGGGRERGAAILDRAVRLSPRGIDSVIAAHELSHIEFHKRLGSARTRVPQWFDEGLAVLVSNDSRYLLPDTAADRCRATPDGDLPANLHQWKGAADHRDELYARAACRVSRWVDTHGGPPAVLDLIQRMRGGEAFAMTVSGP